MKLGYTTWRNNIWKEDNKYYIFKKMGEEMSGTDPHDAQQYVTCPLHRGKAATRFETSAFRRNDSRTLQSACEMLEVAKKETIIFKEMCVQCVRWQDKQGNTYQQILAALTAEFQHCKAVGAQSRKVVHQHLCCCPSQTSYNLTVQARKKEIGKNRNFEEKKTRKKGFSLEKYKMGKPTVRAAAALITGV